MAPRSSATLVEPALFAELATPAESVLFAELATPAESVLFAELASLAEPALFAELASLAEPALFAELASLAEPPPFAELAPLEVPALFAERRPLRPRRKVSSMVRAAAPRPGPHFEVRPITHRATTTSRPSPQTIYSPTKVSAAFTTCNTPIAGPETHTVASPIPSRSNLPKK